jgi:hypothetical protein
MTKFSGSREQQQAGGARADARAGRGGRHSEALQRYLELQQREAARHSQVGASPGQPSAFGTHLRHGRRAGALTHQHLVIDGRDVEVTEDDIGVAELHLE